MIGGFCGPLRQYAGLRQGDGERRLHQCCGTARHFRQHGQPACEGTRGAAVGPLAEPHHTQGQPDRDGPRLLPALHAAPGRPRGNRARRKRHARRPARRAARQLLAELRRAASGAGGRRFHHALSGNLGRTDAERPHGRPDRRWFRCRYSRRAAPRFEPDRAAARAVARRPLRRAQLLRDARQAAHAGRSEGPQLPDDDRIGALSHVASEGRGWHRAGYRAAGNLRSNISSVLETAALAGHGLAWLPTYLCSEALRSGRLVTVLDDYTAPPYTIRALYPHNRHLSAKVRAFVDFLAARFGREPYWDKDCRARAQEPALRVPQPA